MPIFFCFILLLMLGSKIFLFAVFSFLLLVLYPLSKRYFKLPQLVLGLAFGSSIPMVFILERNAIDFNCLLLYFITISWAIVYDTYYAMADKKDDKKLGLKSSAIFFGDNDIRNISKPMKKNATNQRTELKACILALKNVILKRL